jgi:hypothetical protein
MIKGPVQKFTDLPYEPLVLELERKRDHAIAIPSVNLVSRVSCQHLQPIRGGLVHFRVFNRATLDPD